MEPMTIREILEAVHDHVEAAVGVKTGGSQVGGPELCV